MQISGAPVQSPLSPNEKITGVLVFCTVGVSTWGLAGRASWAPPVFTALSLLTALFSLLLSRREGVAINFKAFLPAGLLGLLVAVSLLNPSYTSVAGAPGVWVPRANWLPWLPGTVNRTTTLTAALPWLSALLLGAALTQAALGRRAMRLLWGALLSHGLLVAVVGAFFYFTNNDMVLGLYLDRHGYHFASFIYRNHWAAYVLLLLLMALGFSFSALRRWTVERGGLDALLPGLVAALVLYFTLPMPGSRSGLIIATAVLLGAVVRMGWLLWSARIRYHTGIASWLPLVALIVSLAVALTVGGVFNRDGIRKQWQRTVPQLRGLAAGEGNLRINLTRDSVRMAWARPIWGWGVGSFGFIFPRFQGDYLRDAQGRITARVLHAHDDWAEVWAEMGLVGFVILLTPVVVRLKAIWHRPGVLSHWGGMGVVLILGYALVDFPLHNPAVLFLWVTVLCTAAPRMPARS